MATSTPRWARYDTIKYIQLPLKAGSVAQQGYMCAIDTANGWVVPAVTANTNLINVGQFDEFVDNSGGSGTVLVNVCLDHEIRVMWYANDSSPNNVTALFGTVYMKDGQTVSTNSNSGANAAAGRCWKLDKLKGVAVQATGLI